MFRLLQQTSNETPIEIDFNLWLRARDEDVVPSLDVKVYIVTTDWAYEPQKADWRIPALCMFVVAFVPTADISVAATMLQSSWPLPFAGINKDQNHWDALLRWAMQDALAWQSEQLTIN